MGASSLKGDLLFGDGLCVFLGEDLPLAVFLLVSFLGDCLTGEGAVFPLLVVTLGGGLSSSSFPARRREDLVPGAGEAGVLDDF